MWWGYISIMNVITTIALSLLALPASLLGPSSAPDLCAEPLTDPAGMPFSDSAGVTLSLREVGVASAR